MSQQRAIQIFFNAQRFAVAGASKDHAKYGNKVLRAFLQNELTAYPIHPREDTIEGQTVYPDLAALRERVDAPVPSLAIITPPPVTEKIVREAMEQGVTAIWMQPGAESEEAIETATSAGLTVVAGGPCLLVELGFRENR